MLDMGMLMGIMPPGMQQLYDSIPEIEVMERVANYLMGEHEEHSGHDYYKHGDDFPKTAHFLSMLVQVLKQQGLVQEAREQTEAIRLECPACHMPFSVKNAFQYRRRVEEGFLYACANDHPTTVLGSGRLGKLTPDEQLTFENQPNIVVIFPKEASTITTDEVANPDN